jgi:hypothetical protein
VKEGSNRSISIVKSPKKIPLVWRKKKEIKKEEKKCRVLEMPLCKKHGKHIGIIMC